MLDELGDFLLVKLEGSYAPFGTFGVMAWRGWDVIAPSTSEEICLEDNLATVIDFELALARDLLL